MRDACGSRRADRLPCTPAGIRDHVVQAVELKFNCFFLMPVVDSFPTRLREELEAAYEEDIDEVGRTGSPAAPTGTETASVLLVGVLGTKTAQRLTAGRVMKRRFPSRHFWR